MTTPRRTRQPRQTQQPPVEEPKPTPKIERRPVMTTSRIPLDQMTEEQKQRAFSEWMEKQDSRKITNTAKRAALNRLKAKYEREYNQFLEEERQSAITGRGGNGVGEDA